LSAPQEIVELVDQFSRRINEYRSSLYNETELRNEFVNPFFAALGWDMKNRQGLSSDLKEVKVEESIRVEESVKNPDYSFRLGRNRKFFVETKKPSIQYRGWDLSRLPASPLCLVGAALAIHSHRLRGVCGL
jgi:hypothetical protein